METKILLNGQWRLFGENEDGSAIKEKNHRKNDGFYHQKNRFSV